MSFRSRPLNTEEYIGANNDKKTVEDVKKQDYVLELELETLNEEAKEEVVKKWKKMKISCISAFLTGEQRILVDSKGFECNLKKSDRIEAYQNPEWQALAGPGWRFS